MAVARLVAGCGPGFPLAGRVGGAFPVVGGGWGGGGNGGVARARVLFQAWMRSAWWGWSSPRRMRRLRARWTRRAGTFSRVRRRVAGVALFSAGWWSRARCRSQVSRSAAMATMVHQAWLNAKE